jgi:hypothetical protein
MLSKLVGEDITFEFDMLSRLKLGETLVTSACVATVYSGVDAAPSAILSGLPVISGSIVSQKVINGLPGVIYLLSVSVRSSLSNIFINEGKLAVLSSPAVDPP